MSACHAMPLDAGLIRDILGSVDCNVQAYSAAGYLALTGPGSPLPAALTTMLTIYVVLLGYRMMFAVGSTRLSDTPLIAMKIGVILAVTLNWSVFQTLVFNFDANAPLEIGRLISHPMVGGGSRLASDPIRGIQTAYDELKADAAQLAHKSSQGNDGAPGASNGPVSEADAAAADAAAGLRRAAAALVASTAGVLGMAFIAIGVLTAAGPIFIALFLFEATRGFFVGWIRAIVAAMLTPMVCWIATSLMLVVLAPRIELLAEQRAAQQIGLDTADAASAIVLIFAAAQVALIVGGLLVASGFDLNRRGSSQAPAAAPSPRPEFDVQSAGIETRSRAQALASSLRNAPMIHSREISGVAASSSSSGAPGRNEADGAVAASRPHRLGESYRRAAVTRDQVRVGAAGRA